MRCPWVDRPCAREMCMAWTESREECVLIEKADQSEDGCYSCQAWVESKANNCLGECHANPPDSDGNWPSTASSDWCARWR